MRGTVGVSNLNGIGGIVAAVPVSDVSAMAGGYIDVVTFYQLTQSSIHPPHVTRQKTSECLPRVYLVVPCAPNRGPPRLRRNVQHSLTTSLSLIKASSAWRSKTCDMPGSSWRVSRLRNRWSLFLRTLLRPLINCSSISFTLSQARA